MEGAEEIMDPDIMDLGTGPAIDDSVPNDPMKTLPRPKWS